MRPRRFASRFTRYSRYTSTATTTHAITTTLVSTGSTSPSVPPAACTTSSTTPLTPMATGTAEALDRGLGHRSQAVRHRLVRGAQRRPRRAVARVRSVTRAATIRTNTIVAPDPTTEMPTMIAPSSVSTPIGFAVNP